MVWISDRTFSFTVARLLEGFLNIQTLTLNAGAWSWDLIVGGVDQAITPTVHVGESVSISMTVRNDGLDPDNFLIRSSINGGAPEESSVIPLTVGATSTWSPTSFVMPDRDISIAIETFHEEPD